MMIPFSKIDKNRGVYCSLYLFDAETNKYYLQCNSIIALNVQEVIEFHTYVHHYNLTDLIANNMVQKHQLENGTPLLTSTIDFNVFTEHFNEFLTENEREPITNTYNYWLEVKRSLAEKQSLISVDEDQHRVLDQKLFAVFDFIKG